MDTELKDAIGAFFVEFSKFEMHSVGMALRSLSKDSVFVVHAEQLLDLEARLKLLERMAFARGVPPAIMAELEACLMLARKLREHRDEVARNLSTAAAPSAHPLAGAADKRRASRRRNADLVRLAGLESLWAPDVARVHEFAEEAAELQETLGALTQKLERHVTAVPATA